MAVASVSRLIHAALSARTAKSLRYAVSGSLVSPAKPLSIFYGYPAELVARWCAVSLRTANSYKLGTRKPSRQSLRLFAMHRDGKVLTDDWDGWSVHKGSLVDPDGNSTTRNQLRAYWLVMQLAAELANRNPADRRLYDDILRLA